MKRYYHHKAIIAIDNNTFEPVAFSQNLSRLDAQQQTISACEAGGYITTDNKYAVILYREHIKKSVCSNVMFPCASSLDLLFPPTPTNACVARIYVEDVDCGTIFSMFGLFLF